VPDLAFTLKFSPHVLAHQDVLIKSILDHQNFTQNNKNKNKAQNNKLIKTNSGLPPKKCLFNVPSLMNNLFKVDAT